MSSSSRGRTPLARRPSAHTGGDVNTAPGQKKLMLSGFPEAALGAFGAAPHIFPDRRVTLRYTTTSPKLDEVPGAETPDFD